MFRYKNQKLNSIFRAFKVVLNKDGASEIVSTHYVTQDNIAFIGRLTNDKKSS